MTDFVTEPTRPLRADTVDEDIINVFAAVSPFGGLVAGGAARWMHAVGGDDPLLTPSDIDVFMVHGDVNMVYGALYDLEYRITYHRENVVTFTRDGHLKVQVVNLWPRPISPSAVLADFAFTVEMFALIPMVGQPCVLTALGAVTDTIFRMLHVNVVHDPIRHAWRSHKYARKGFTMTPNEMARIFEPYGNVDRSERERWQARNLTLGENDVAYDADERPVYTVAVDKADEGLSP